jgi:hypothetical protein
LNKSFAEVFLRLGCTLVAFMVLIGHLLWLSILPRIDCSTDGASLWFALFGLAPLTFVLALLLLTSRPLTSVVSMLKWGCLPVGLLVPMALLGTLPTFSATTLGGAPICPDISAQALPVWQQVWGPVQLGLIALIAIQTLRYWMMANQAEKVVRS